jgi:hypothetical protein
MSLAFHGKSGQRRGWLIAAGLFSVGLAALAGGVLQGARDVTADDTGVLLPAGPGTYEQWRDGTLYPGAPASHPCAIDFSYNFVWGRTMAPGIPWISTSHPFPTGQPSRVSL